MMITWDSLCSYFGVDSSKTRHLVMCPCHEDQNPSLSIRLGPSGKVLIHCFAGCSFASVAGSVRDGAPRQTALAPAPSSSAAPRQRDWSKLMVELPADDSSFARHLMRKIGTGTTAGYRRLYPKLRLIPNALLIPAICVWDPELGGQALPLFADSFGSKSSGRVYKKYTIPGTCCKVPLFFGDKKKGQRIMICEGISDWLALASNDDSLNTVYMPMLGAAQTLREDAAAELQTYETYCLFDNDSAGRDGFRKLQALTGCSRLAPPEGYKDWREWLCQQKPTA